MKKNIMGFIFARGGSKGVPRKNIRDLAGKPLIAYAIQAACDSQHIRRVIVSTDDTEIAKTAVDYGAEVPFLRPQELAGDKSPEWLAWQHAISQIQQTGEPLDIFVSVPTTAPLRLTEDIDSCITKLLNSDADIAITVKKAERSPYFNMVRYDENGYVRLVIPTDSATHRRQDAPEVYDMTTVAYAARPEFVMSAKNMFDGKVLAVEIPPERALDIDTEFDFAIAEFLIRKRNNQSDRWMK
ncbi:MAG: acylneuraminate cytidylyltransferase family protein [Methanoregula sp.]